MTLRPAGGAPIIATNANWVSGPDAGQPTKVAPPSGLLQDGWHPGEEPAPSHFNHVENAQSRVAGYLDTIDLQNTIPVKKDWVEMSPALTDYPEISGKYGVAYRGRDQTIWIGGNNPGPGPTKYVARTHDAGRSWTAKSMNVGMTGNPKHIAFSQTTTAAGDGGFVATGGTQGAYYDPGGDVFVAANPVNVGTIGGVIWCPGAVEPFLIFGQSSTNVAAAWTSNASAPTQRTVAPGPGAGFTLKAACWGGASLGFLASGDNGTTQTSLWTSPTGATWTNTGALLSGIGWDVAADTSNGLFVRCNADGSSIASSPDGTTWTARGALPGATPFPDGHEVHKVLCRGGVWMIITRTTLLSSRRCLLWISVDLGTTWEMSVLPLPSGAAGLFCSALLIQDTAERLAVGCFTSLVLGLRAR